MSTADLIATLRRLALVDDLPESQAADLIERLRGVIEAHVVQAITAIDVTDDTSAWKILCAAEECDFETTFTGTGPELIDAIHEIGAAHVAAILDEILKVLS